jgi:hypothetical protein
MHDVQRVTVRKEVVPATVNLLTGAQRVGDRDREHTVDRINDYAARGYMSDEERDARVEAALEATSTGRLSDLVDDLPREQGVSARSPITRLFAWGSQDSGHMVTVIGGASVVGLLVIMLAALMGFANTFTQVSGAAMIVAAVTMVVAVGVGVVTN